MNWDMVSEKNKSKIEKTTDKIAKELSRTPKPKVSIKTKALFGIMRMIQVKGMGSSEVEKNYWEKNGWLSKERPWK